MKIITPLGEIGIYIDSGEVDYSFRELPLDDVRYPKVVKRYLITVNIDNKAIKNISCRIIGFSNAKVYFESGEDLECQGFYKEDIKLSIGIEAEKCDTEYLLDGMAYHLNDNVQEVLFGIAWMKGVTDDTDYQSWLAADPTINPG